LFDDLEIFVRNSGTTIHNFLVEWEEKRGTCEIQIVACEIERDVDVW